MNRERRGWVALDDAPALLAAIRDFIHRERWKPPDRASLPVGMRGRLVERRTPLYDESSQLKPARALRNPVPGVLWDA